jgi:hypothetical protein
VGDPHVYSVTAAPETDDGRYRVMAYGIGPLVVPKIKALNGCLFACKRVVTETIRFDSETFDGFQLYDVDFSCRAFVQGTS